MLLAFPPLRTDWKTTGSAADMRFLVPFSYFVSMHKENKEEYTKIVKLAKIRERDKKPPVDGRA